MAKEKDDARNTSDLNLEDESNTSKKNPFYIDMCRAMVSVNMPWRSLVNEVWRNFLLKYTKQKIPDESTLRKNYLHDCYNLAIQDIRNDIGENYVWLSVDETTDNSGRNIANLMVGKLCEDEKTKPHLLACGQLEQTNHATISRFVNSAMRVLWPNGGEDKVLLLVTDAAAYMLKPGRNLKIFYPNMLHVTCLVHGLNRIAKEVRLPFCLVDKLISSVKKVFLKAPLRVERYRMALVNVPLPPEPILTRWGTWLEAAVFYAMDLENIREVIQSFDKKDGISIKAAQEVLKSSQLPHDLAFIKAHLAFLLINMKKLGTVGLTITESMEIVDETIKNIKGIPGVCGEKVAAKIDAVTKRNPGFDDIIKVSKILRGVSVEEPKKIQACCSRKFKYAPITSCDVERSFSAYKLIFTDKRHKFTLDNLEKTIVTYCHSNYNQLL